MKLFTKIALGICLVCLVLGGVLVVVGGLMGARMGQYLDLDMDDYVEHHIEERLEEHVENHVGDHTKEPEKQPVPVQEEAEKPGPGAFEFDETYTEKVSGLQISASAAEIYLYTRDQEGIRILANHVGNSFRCRMDGSELEIFDDRLNSVEALEISVYLPKSELPELDIEAGAGVLYAEEVLARDFSLQVGGGECVIKSLRVGEEAGLHVGAGRVEIEKFIGNKLEGECGAGELSLCLAGKPEDYNYELQVAVGEICLGDHAYSGLANKHHVRNQANKNIDLECAMGSVVVSFEEE